MKFYSKDFDSTHIETADDGTQTTVESIWDEAWDDLKAAEQLAADEVRRRRRSAGGPGRRRRCAGLPP